MYIVIISLIVIILLFMIFENKCLKESYKNSYEGLKRRAQTSQLALDKLINEEIKDKLKNMNNNKLPVIDELNFKPCEFDFELSCLKSRIGIDYKKDKVKNILSNLGFKIDDKGETLNLTAPSWRPDITMS